MKLNRTNLEDNIVIGLLLFAPFAFASVHVWAYSIIAIASVILFNIHFMWGSNYFVGGASGPEKTRRSPLIQCLKRPTSIAILIFLGINILYIIPLPGSIVRFLNPNLYSMRQEYMFQAPIWQAFSSYPRATLSYIIKLISFILCYLVILSKLTNIPIEQRVKLHYRPRSIYQAFILFGAIMGVLSILFHAFVDFNLHMPANALYFTVLLTIIAALAPSLQGANKTQKPSLRGGRRPTTQSINYPFLNKLVNTIIIVGFLAALFGIIQKFSWNGKMFWCIPKLGNNFGPFVCYNNFAGFMEMTVFFAISLFYAGLFMSPLRHMKRIKDKLVWFSSSMANKTLLYLFMSIVMVGALFICLSRGGIISFTLSFLYFVIICLAISPKTRKVKALIFSGVVLVLFIAMIIWLGPQATIARFIRLKEAIILLLEGKKVLWLLRPCIWIDTVKVIKTFPITGTGLGTYSYIFMPFRTFPESWGFLRYAHQDYLQLFSELGLVGAGFLAAFLIWYSRRFRECIRRLKTGAEHLEKN